MSNPIHDIESLNAAIQQGLKPEWLFFWGHQPSRDGTITKTCFSQWWEGFPFEVDGVTYQTAEHYMMAEKARLFDDTESIEKIVQSSHPREAKKLGRGVQGFDEKKWQAERFQIVVRGNLAKFSQHSSLADFLISTDKQIIVEASPQDRVWGIGLRAEDERATNPQEWRGLNLLGFALMEVRHSLRAT